MMIPATDLLRRRVRLAAPLFATVLTLSIVGCSSGGTGASNDATGSNAGEDKDHVTVVVCGHNLHAATSDRVVVAGAGNLSTVLAAGGAGKVVGVTGVGETPYLEEIFHGAEVRKIPQVSKDPVAVVDQIKKVHPGLYVAGWTDGYSDHYNTGTNPTSIEEAGIIPFLPAYGCKPGGKALVPGIDLFPFIAADTVTVGMLMGTEKKALAAAKQLKERATALRGGEEFTPKPAANAPKVVVVDSVMRDGQFLIAGLASPVRSAVELAGGKLAGDHIEDMWVPVKAEVLRGMKPQLVVVASDDNHDASATEAALSRIQGIPADVLVLPAESLKAGYLLIDAAENLHVALANRDLVDRRNAKPLHPISVN